MRRATCRQQVIDFIKKMILSGELKAGERIKEAYIAAATGLSRAPVREAVVELCREGLLQFEPNKGASVTKPTAQDLHTSYEICGLLEGYLAGLNMPFYTPRHFAEIEAILEQMKAAQEDPRDMTALSDLDYAFHDAIISASDNPLLVEFARHHNAKFEHFFFSQFWAEAFAGDDFYGRHRKVYDAVRTGVPYTAETAMREHYADCARRTAKYADYL